MCGCMREKGPPDQNEINKRYSNLTPGTFLNNSNNTHKLR